MEIANTTLGSSNAIPKPRKSCRTNDIRSLIIKKGFYADSLPVLLEQIKREWNYCNI